MRWLQGNCGGVDSLDIAAVWPVSGSVAGLALPELGSAPSSGDRSAREDKKERL